jgi:3-deoxy-D-manno-octulosonic acid (KDO) 8-phosphate synthase
MRSSSEETFPVYADASPMYMSLIRPSQWLMCDIIQLPAFLCAPD